VIRVGANQQMRIACEPVYLGLGGGGLGTPVVSYAPRPKLDICSEPVEIMVSAWSRRREVVVELDREEDAC
jgi:hypothetical protein